jgi:hypothetical protein
MNNSAEIKDLTIALAKFHSIVGKIKKDAKNPFFKSSYASLSHILDEIAEPLQISGLVISQFPDGDSLTTMLIHAETGQYLSASYTMPVAKQNDPQALGSSISYARRYAVSSILSLQIDDDDAEGAMNGKGVDDDPRPWLNKGDALNKAMEYLRTGKGSMAEIEKKYRLNKEVRASLQLIIDTLNK